MLFLVQNWSIKSMVSIAFCPNCTRIAHETGEATLFFLKKVVSLYILPTVDTTTALVPPQPLAQSINGGHAACLMWK
jgi:hypothetical protein